jgi:deoxyribonuclease V
MDAWLLDAAELDAEQRRIAALRPPLWVPPPGALRVAGCFLAFARGQQGPGHPGDRGWAAAVTMRMPGAIFEAEAVVPVVAAATYERGRLALREGAALQEAVTHLPALPDVLLVDATGRDHPRGAGLALHLGAVIDVPTVGVTHRPMLARGNWPPNEELAFSPLSLDEEVVGAWMRTRRNARPLAVHAAWRTDARVAVDVVGRCLTSLSRTPEPLRRARVSARVARARAEGRIA